MEENGNYETIENLIEEDAKLLRKLEFGSEEYERGVNGIVALRKTNIDDSKTGAEWDRRDHELEVQEKELEIRQNELDYKYAELEQKADEFDKDFELRMKEFESQTEQAAINAKAAHDGKILDHILSWGGLLIPLAIYARMTNKTMKFEETGIITTNSCKNSMNQLFSFIKKKD